MNIQHKDSYMSKQINHKNTEILTGHNSQLATMNLPKKEGFWHLDRFVTILTFAFSLGSLILVPYTGLFTFAISLFVIPFLFGQINPITAAKTKDGKKNIVFNSRGIDITERGEFAMKYCKIIAILIFASFQIIPSFIFDLAWEYKIFSEILKFFLAYSILYGFFFFAGLPILIVTKIKPKGFEYHANPSPFSSSSSSDHFASSNNLYTDSRHSWCSGNVYNRRND